MTTTRNDDTLTVALSGRLDTLAANALQNAMKDLAGVNKLVFDLARLDYISSAGLRVFLFTHKYMAGVKGSMTLKNVVPPVMGVLNMTGFSSILTIAK